MRRFVVTLCMLVTVVLGVGATLTATSSGRVLPPPPSMLRVGAPAHLAATYAAVRDQGAPLVRDGQVVGVATFAGTPNNWVLAGTLAGSTSFAASAKQVVTSFFSSDKQVSNLLFVLPGEAVTGRPLKVRVKGHDYRLQVLDVDSADDVAIAVARLTLDQQGDLGAGRPTWMTPALPRAASVVVVARSDPRRDDAVGYALGSADLAAGTAGGVLHGSVSARGAGTPVMMYAGRLAPALMGFVTRPTASPPRIVSTSKIAAFLQAVATAYFVRFAHAGQIGIDTISPEGAAGGKDLRSGALVRGLAAGAPAEAAGLKAGELITAVSGSAAPLQELAKRWNIPAAAGATSWTIPVSCASALIAIARLNAPGTDLTLTVVGVDGSERKVHLSLGVTP